MLMPTPGGLGKREDSRKRKKMDPKKVFGRNRIIASEEQRSGSTEQLQPTRTMAVNIISIFQKITIVCVISMFLHGFGICKRK